jgi:hypothetical protein
VLRPPAWPAAGAVPGRAREWHRVNGLWKPEEFRESIYPLLADVSIRELVRRTGLSLAYSRQIKRGLVVPHPMWWEEMRIVGATMS